MKNKLVMVALAAAMLCALSFGACKQDVQDVSIAEDKAEAVASVTVTKISGQTAYIVTWDAVDDAGGYQVYVRVNGAKTLETISAQNYVTYSDDGTSKPNANPDKWAASVSFATSGGASVVLPAGTYSVEFGVQTGPFNNNSINAANSDIVWSSAVTVAL
jgi:hypothetical protein